MDPVTAIVLLVTEILRNFEMQFAAADDAQKKILLQPMIDFTLFWSARAKAIAEAFDNLEKKP
jgi:hypothetical protein